MKISIALCTYNGERFLAEQLDSILAQTRPPDEVVVRDDRSSDSTVAIVKHFVERASFPIRIEVNPINLGSTKNFEKAVLACSGDIIFLADQDDVWAPDKLEAVAKIFENSGSVGLVFTDAGLVDEAGCDLGKRLWEFTFPRRRRKRADGRRFYEILLESNVVTGATAAFRASAIGGCFPIPTDIPDVIHDGWMALVASVSHEIVWSEAPLIKYRQHPGQQLGVNAGSRERMDFPRAVEILNLRLAALEAVNHKLAQYPALAAGGKIAGAIASKRSALVANITHLENRIALLSKKQGRLPLIFTELLSGRYRRFSKGALSAAKDLFQR